MIGFGGEDIFNTCAHILVWFDLLEQDEYCKLLAVKPSLYKNLEGFGFTPIWVQLTINPLENAYLIINFKRLSDGNQWYFMNMPVFCYINASFPFANKKNKIFLWSKQAYFLDLEPSRRKENLHVRGKKHNLLRLIN